MNPSSFAWPVIATVNRWNPLAWVGVVWALMCLLIYACLSCLLLLRVELGLIHRGWIRGVRTCPTVCEVSAWTRFGKGSGERPCRSTWWVVSLQPSSGTEFCVCDPWTVTTTHWSYTIFGSVRQANPLVHSDTIPLSRSCSLLLH